MSDSLRDRDEELKEVPFQRPDQSIWPKGVRSIGIDEADALGIDKAGRLYWHGKPIQMRQTIKLRAWEFGLAVIVAVSAAIQAFAAVFALFQHR